MFLFRACSAKRCDCTRSTSYSSHLLPGRCSGFSAWFLPCLLPRFSRLPSTNFICDRANPITLRSIAKQQLWWKAKSDAHPAPITLSCHSDRTRGISLLMKLKITLIAAFSLFAVIPKGYAEKIALVNGTLINPATSQVLENSIVVIDGEKIAASGDTKTVSVLK